VELKGKGARGTSCSSTGTGSHSAGRPTGTVSRFARAHRSLLGGVCVTVFLAVVVFFDSSLSKLVAYNRSDLLILGCEMLTEAGPRLQDSVNRQRVIIPRKS